MHTHNLIIAYFGTTHAAALSAQAEREGSLVIQADEVLAALGQVIVYYPDVIFIEDSTTFPAQEVYMHLRSIDVTNLIVLSDHPHAWEGENGLLILPMRASANELLHTARSVCALTTPLSA